MATTAYGHSDHPLGLLSEDRLGLAPYAESLAEFILHCETPMTVAIQGDWGTGKTSLMRMVENSMQPDIKAERVQPVWFNTWQYSQFGTNASLPASLLTTLMRCLSGEPTSIEWVKNAAVRLGRPAANAAIRMATHGLSELGDISLVDEAMDAATTVNKLKAEIKKLIADRHANGVERIVVFVDDLDRILPERAVEILEIMKLFIDWDGCVFVLALDYEVVKRGLKKRFEMSEEELRGRSFFDKIIQLPFSIPTSKFDMKGYVGGLFDKMDLQMGAEDPDLFERLIGSSVSTNPRGVKRAFNSLQLLILLAQKQGGALPAGTEAEERRLVIRILFAVLCLQISYEDIYQWVTARGHDISSADVVALSDGDSGSSRQDPDLAAALATLDEPGRQGPRRADFARFAQAFAEAVQVPGQSLDVIDDEELGRLQKTLALTRVTAVQSSVEASADKPQDREFRWKNRKMMDRACDALNEALSGRIVFGNDRCRIYQPQTSSEVRLMRQMDSKRIYWLAIGSFADSFAVFVESRKRAIAAAEPTLRACLEPIAGPDYLHQEYGPDLYERKLDEKISIEERTRVLLEEVVPFFLKAHAALQGKLEPGAFKA